MKEGFRAWETPPFQGDNWSANNLQEGDRMGTLDIGGMFSNVPVKQTFQVTRDKLEKDETLSSKTKLSVDEIMKLLEISIETYFKQ